MLRKVLYVVTLLALTLALAAPAFADKPPDKGKPQGTPGVGQSAPPGQAQAKQTAKGKAVHGTIAEISGTIWVLNTTRGDQTAQAQTSVRVDVTGVQAKIPGLKNVAGLSVQKGDRVVVQLASRTPIDTTTDTFKARQAMVVPGRTFAHFTGQVVGGTSDPLVVKNAQNPSGKSFDVTLDSTPVLVGRTVKKLSEAGLKADDLVTVVYRTSTGSEPPPALAIRLHASRGNAQGEEQNEERNGGQDERKAPPANKG